MKLILENWRKFLKEEVDPVMAIINAGWIADFLQIRSSDADIVKTIKNRYGINIKNLDEVEDALEDMIINAPDDFPLKTKQAKKELGAGTFGIALLMPDDLVLKVYWGSFNPVNRKIRSDDAPEREKYAKIQQKLTNPVKGNITDPNIIAQGTVKLKDGDLGWVLMSKFDETLLDMLKRIIKSVNNQSAKNEFIYEIQDLLEKINPDLKIKKAAHDQEKTAIEIPQTPTASVPSLATTAPAKKMNESSLSVDKIDKKINMMKQKYKKFGLDIKEMDRLKVILKNILERLPELRSEVGPLTDVRPPNIGLIGDSPVFFDY
jgi:hypothetical protein